MTLCPLSRAYPSAAAYTRLSTSPALAASTSRLEKARRSVVNMPLPRRVLCINPAELLTVHVIELAIEVRRTRIWRQLESPRVASPRLCKKALIIQGFAVSWGQAREVDRGLRSSPVLKTW